MAGPKKKMVSSNGQRKKVTSQFTLMGGGDDLTVQKKTKKTLKETVNRRIIQIDISKLKDNPDNTFGMEQSLELLKSSIRAIGLMQPIVVVQLQEDGRPTGYYEIKAGSRRYNSILQLVEEAKEKGNQEEAELYSSVACIVLPEGATKEEIDKVKTDLNTTARHLTISDIFRNFDMIFAKDENGLFKYISKGGNKYNEGAKLLEQLGFKYSPDSIKDYLTIYNAHNPEVKKLFENKAISKNQAKLISQMDFKTQDDLVERIPDMTSKEITQSINEYKKKKKQEKEMQTKPQGAVVLSYVAKTSRKFQNYSRTGIALLDDQQKKSIMNAIDELKENIKTLESMIEK